MFSFRSSEGWLLPHQVSGPILWPSHTQNSPPSTRNSVLSWSTATCIHLLFVCVFPLEFNHSIKQRPDTYYVPGTISGAENTPMNKADTKSHPHRACMLEHKIHEKENCLFTVGSTGPVTVLGSLQCTINIRTLKSKWKWTYLYFLKSFPFRLYYSIVITFTVKAWIWNPQYKIMPLISNSHNSKNVLHSLIFLKSFKTQAF